MAPQPKLPDELVFDILLRLPPKELIVCTCVCKAWNATIHHQHLIKAHSQRSIQTNSHRTLLIMPCWEEDFFSVAFYDDDTFGREAVEIKYPLKRPRVITSRYCKGLLCIEDDSNFDFWNPSIQRSKKIPFTPVEQPSGTEETTMSYGFGYDSTNDDHKLVRIMLFANRDSESEFIVSSEVKVYSLKSNSWKRIQDLPRNDFGFYFDVQFLNGALNWLMMDQLDDKRFMVLTLDLASEKYNEFPTPVGGDGDSMLSPHVLGGCLCICVNHYKTRNDVWIMKEYGVTESWTMLYSIEQGAFPCFFKDLTPLVLSKSGEMVLLQQDHDRLFWYDLEKKRVEQVEIDGMPYPFNAAICVGNLYLLDGDPVTVGRHQSVPSV